MPLSPGDDIVVLGRLGDPYGVRGWLHLRPFGDDPLSWAAMPVWWVQLAGVWQPVGLKQLKSHAQGLVVWLDGVTDRALAEKLKGTLVGAPRADLPATDGDEYYWADLIGLQVINGEGCCLGRIAGLIETGAHDVLQVRDEAGHERLLPFVDAVVHEVDRQAGLVKVTWGADW